MIEIAPGLVEKALSGDQVALQELISSIQRPIFGLAMRFLASRPDAEDASQEILLKVVTHLTALKDKGAAGGWVLRIACNHLIRHRRASAVESQRLSFTAFAADLMDGFENSSPDIPDPEHAYLVEQVKLGCTLALLTCLSRPARAAYILGDIFELPDVEASHALETDQTTYRKRLSRARGQVAKFTRAWCGLASERAPCNCPGRLPAALRLGRVARGERATDRAAWSFAALSAEVRKLEEGRRTAAIMRSNRIPERDFSPAILAAVLGDA